MKDIKFFENISNIYKKISHAAMRAGRSPEDIKLIAVTKTVGIERIKDAIDAGLRMFGESRVQEAKRKVTELTNPPSPPFSKGGVGGLQIQWHLIGHLQKNKAKAAVELFDLIHSVDSLELAEIINRHAEKMDKIQNILLQVKLSGDESKYGILKENLISLIGQISELKNLNLKGLMTIPPYFENPEDARPYFRELRRLRDEAVGRGVETPSLLPELSMGMTNDFEVAVEEGATMVRIGTAIFGEREYTKEA